MELTDRMDGTDSPVEAMVKKAISQAMDTDRPGMHDECSNQAEGMGMGMGMTTRSNDHKSYQDTELFRQLSQNSSRQRFHSQNDGCGELARHNGVHDVSHWKALPNPLPRPNETYVEVTPSPAGSTMSYSEDSNNSSSNQSIPSQNSEHHNNKTPMPAGFMNSNSAAPSIFDFNINNVRAYNQDSSSDAEVQYLFQESSFASPPNYQEKPIPQYSYSAQHSPAQSPGYDWPTMNQQHHQQGWNNVSTSGQQHQMSTGMVQQQMLGNGYQHSQISNGVIQPQRGFQQQQPMSNTDMHQHHHSPPMNNCHQGSCNAHNRANPPRFINLEMCNNQPIQQQGPYSPLYPPPSPFLQQQRFEPVSPTTPPFHALQTMLQHQQYQQPIQPKPNHVIQNMHQNQQHVGLGQSQAPLKNNQKWIAAPPKKARKGSNANAKIAPAPSALTITNAGPKALIHYRPSPRKPAAPMVPVTEIIKGNTTRIAAIVSEATRTSEVWKQPKDATNAAPTRYILVQDASGKLAQHSTIPTSVVQHMLQGVGASGAKGRGTHVRGGKVVSVGRSGSSGPGYQLKLVPSPTGRVSSPVDGHFGSLRNIASDPSKALKEIVRLRLLLDTQSVRLMHTCKELETYRTALSISDMNPYKLELVKLCGETEQKNPKLKPSKTDLKLSDCDLDSRSNA